MVVVALTVEGGKKEIGHAYKKLEGFLSLWNRSVISAFFEYIQKIDLFHFKEIFYTCTYLMYVNS